MKHGCPGKNIWQRLRELYTAYKSLAVIINWCCGTSVIYGSATAIFFRDFSSPGAINRKDGPTRRSNSSGLKIIRNIVVHGVHLSCELGEKYRRGIQQSSRGYDVPAHRGRWISFVARRSSLICFLFVHKVPHTELY